MELPPVALDQLAERSLVASPAVAAATSSGWVSIVSPLRTKL
jgi:hypothetical protein